MSAIRLDCCAPTAYAPGSVLAHSPVCSLYQDQILSKVEQHEWSRRATARREAETQASASGHPTAPDAPWWVAHDLLAAQGLCDDPVCYRCDALDDNPPKEFV